MLGFIRDQVQRARIDLSREMRDVIIKTYDSDAILVVEKEELL